MLFGSLTNIFIALALTFASTALLVSTAVEAIASGLKWRANNLIEGLKTILNAKTPSTSGSAGLFFLPFWRLFQPFNNTLPLASGSDNAKRLHDLLNHAAINARGPGDCAAQSAKRANQPSYIPPQQFALALLDVLQTGDGTGARLGLKQAIDGISDTQLKQYLQGAYERAAGDATRLRAEIANWFDSTMDRLSGVYKRHTQLWSVLIGFLAAAFFNIDALKIAHVALTNPALVTNITANISTTDGFSNLGVMKTSALAVGWNFTGNEGLLDLIASKWHIAVTHHGEALLKLIGWFITATAALFGAPFWFDTLQRFVSLRGTGDPPSTTPTPPPAS